MERMKYGGGCVIAGSETFRTPLSRGIKQVVEEVEE